MTRPASASRAGSCSPSAPRQLATDDGILVAGLALAELLADAQDRAQPGLDRPAELAADQLVGLAGVAPPLRVADDDPRREPDEHRGRDLAGVGALELVMDVLGADRRRRDRSRPARRGPRRGRRTAGR